MKPEPRNRCVKLRNFIGCPETPAALGCNCVTGVTDSRGGGGASTVGNASDAEGRREEFEERAAILEYDAGMNREDAERLAHVLTGWSGL